MTKVTKLYATLGLISDRGAGVMNGRLLWFETKDQALVEAEGKDSLMVFEYHGSIETDETGKRRWIPKQNS